jgi:hypothetical protein
MWQVPKIWEDADVWILGGGPSVTEQFNIPKSIVQRVISGESVSLYSPYMSAIHDKHVIGINVSYHIGNWIDMVFFGDNSFFLREQDGLARFPGLKISSHPQLEGKSWIKYLGRDSKRPRGISPNPKMVSWNGNSGAAAISIAVHTGAKRIILLGFDMKLDLEGKQHWHDMYHRMKSIKKNALPFDRHLLGFPEIARDAKRMNVEILNASPNSAITNFRKVTVSDLLKVPEFCLV